ncbi:hypothetical protein [uncultured Variovorax sp.]|uniref:hypothetical protein n=1 Tax=uncultured Variovorax sp. TaxID=114708 RepID=UPI0025D74AA4|nr:hypothetical protein [uncultured Variovorax sp.]
MDDDDKIRRNLMLTSAVIISVAWFDVSLPDMLERLFSIRQTASTPGTVVQLSGLKVWLAAAVVLGYMSWRYRWSDEVEKAATLYSDSVVARYKILFGTDYMTKVTQWFKSGSLPGDAHPQLAVAYAQLVPHALSQQMGRGPAEVAFSGPGPASIDHGNHVMAMTATWPTPGTPGSGHVIQQPVNIYIDIKRQDAMIRKAHWFVLANSKASMSLVWPAVVACFAALIVLYKLARAIFG